MEVAEVLRLLAQNQIGTSDLFAAPFLRQVRLSKNIHNFYGAGTLKSRFVI